MARKKLNKAENIERGKKNAVFKKKNGEVCVYCGCRNRLLLTVDHITPLIRGGNDTNKNKQVCCFLCNQLKGALNHEEYIKYLDALNTLKDLCKLKVAMLPPRIIFRPWFFPGYTEKEEEEIK